MSNNKHGGGIFAGKGYMLALILCAAAIGITGFLYSKDQKEAEPVSHLETQEEVLAGFTEDVPVLATQPAPTGQIPTGTAPVPVPTVKRTMETLSPVEGEAINGYSVEALSYNQTTRDWRVHNGVDLAAEAGTQVVAAADGEVFAVFQDDALGTTVVIRHQEGYTTKYASLAEEVAVKPGDRVAMGQVIGCASDTAITESSLGAHVHFSVTNQDQPMDPAEFLSLGK